VSRLLRSVGALAAFSAVAACVAIGAATAPAASAAGAGPLPIVTMQATRPSAGQGTACAVQTDSTVACWGSNGYGQLGVDHRPYSLVGKRSTGLSGARAVTEGWEHTCVLLDDGSATCFGRNDAGDLGPGAASPIAWTPSSPFRGPAAFLALSAGWQHTCGLLANHTVVCFGRNNFGQLGDTTTRSSSAPRPVRGLAHVASISAGANFTCAVLSTHRVACWGQNASGQLGLPNTVRFVAHPVTIPGISNARSVSAGFAHVCVVLSTRRVACWGSDVKHQAGIPGPVAWTPVPHLVAGVTTATAVASGYDHTCALLATRKVVCWGWDMQGQLGNARTGRTFSAQVVVGLSGATSITSGFQFSCAALAGALVKCWGTGGTGQLGVGGRAQWNHPYYAAEVRVPGP